MIDYKEIRRTLHEHPQTAGNEQFAHDMIVKHLQGLHPTKVYTNVGGYGVIAVWETKDSSNQAIKHSSIPTIAFRADTDALPIGHRCGHDGHTTILLRLAELIDEKFSILNSQFSIPHRRRLHEDCPLVCRAYAAGWGGAPFARCRQLRRLQELRTSRRLLPRTDIET